MKTLVSACDSLDIRQLSRKGFLFPHYKFEWAWRRKDGTIKGAIAIYALKDRLILSYRDGGNSIRDIVRLVNSTGYPSSRRPWFKCPACNQKVALLYKSGARFRCRRCSDLVYASQYRSSSGSGHGRR